MPSEALVVTAKSRDQLKCPSTGEQTVVYLTLKHYSPVERNELLTHATTCTNLKIIMLSRKKDQKEITYHLTPLKVQEQRIRNHGDGSQISGYFSKKKHKIVLERSSREPSRCC